VTRVIINNMTAVSAKAKIPNWYSSPLSGIMLSLAP
jgi:hypothetical protein